MSALMTELEPAPQDPLLGLMLAVRDDPRPDKVDLGVGIYKDADGRTPVLGAVKAAERQLLESEETKAYEGPHGNPLFCQGVERLVMGKVKGDRTIFATPGGCGALSIGMQLAREISPSGRLFLSDPTWPNHQGIAEANGFEIERFGYHPTTEGHPDLGLMMEGLGSVRRGDIVLLQGPCHNPTGTDLSAEQWDQVVGLLIEREALLLIDIAYQGFGRGLEEDIAPVQRALAQVPEAIVTYSCSKNFGLYRERTGALIVKAADGRMLDAARSRAASLIRSSYSMPPAHGAAVVGTILNDPKLLSMWTDELDAMRSRLNRLRQAFAASMVEETGDESFQRLANEKGMFSLLPLAPEAIMALRQEHGIYMPSSGRANIAGLPEERVRDVARVMARALAG
jgi:aspartate aminotransferase/aromatic-amino-acid transaminase